MSWNTHAFAEVKEDSGTLTDNAAILGDVQFKLIWRRTSPDDVAPTSMSATIAVYGRQYADVAMEEEGPGDSVDGRGTTADGLLGLPVQAHASLPSGQYGDNSDFQGDTQAGHKVYLYASAQATPEVNGEVDAYVLVGVDSVTTASATGEGDDGFAYGEGVTQGSMKVIKIGSIPVSDDYPGGNGGPVITIDSGTPGDPNDPNIPANHRASVVSPYPSDVWALFPRLDGRYSFLLSAADPYDRRKSV